MKKFPFLNRHGIFLGALVAISLLFSCGGGGGDAGTPVSGTPDSGTTPSTNFTPPTSGTLSIMDRGTATTVAGMVLISMDFSGTSIVSDFSVSSVSRNTLLEKRSIPRTISNVAMDHFIDAPYQTTAKIQDSSNCSDSGTNNITVEWPGGELPSDPCTIQDAFGTMEFNNCLETNGLLMNGTMAFEYGGGLCQPTQMLLILSDFYIQNDDDSIEMPSLDMNFENMIWSGGEPTSGHATLNGQMVVTQSSYESAMAFDSMVETFSYDNTYGRSTYEISGNITGPCLNGWVILNTIEPVVTQGQSDCPTTGELSFTGADGVTMNITFASNGHVFLDDEDLGLCTDINASCPIN